MTSKHIHIIGICGVGTGAIAVALKNAGYRVTGSDKGFFPPVSTALEEAGVSFYAGWHPEKMGTPDIVIAGGGGTSLSNPEITKAKTLGIPMYSFAQAVGEFIVKETSIVCVGTWGKTSLSALLSFIFEQARLDPSYFFGGLSAHNKSGAIGKGTVSIVEGDEYQAAIWDKKPKFFYYKPTHILISAVSWDHADLYPTEASYFKVFEDLINSATQKGFVVACADSEHVRILTQDVRRLKTYGKDANADYRYEGVEETSQGLRFTIVHNLRSYDVVSPLLGAFQAENITGCFAMAHQYGIPHEKILTAIQNFKGLKRRLEKRVEGKITVIDDIAHSPSKARSILASLRHMYTGKIIAIFEPNIGARVPEVARAYDYAFQDADTVLIPRLSKLKVGNTPYLEGVSLADTIRKTHKNVHYIEEDDALVAYIRKVAQPEDVIVFLGSHGFRGMIDAVVEGVKTLE